MISVISGLLIGFVFLFKFNKDKDLSKKELAFLAVIVSCVFFVVIELLLCATSCLHNTSQKIELVSTQTIISLADQSSASGKHFLGCGSINSDDYYIYYAKDEHGYKRHKIVTNNPKTPAYIKYISPDDTPHVDFYQTVSRIENKPTAWVSLVYYFTTLNKSVGDILGEPSFPGRIEIYIPEGSIQENYNIDLE